MKILSLQPRLLLDLEKELASLCDCEGVEIRLEFLDQKPDFSKLRTLVQGKLIFTCRMNHCHEQKNRKEWLLEALEFADYMDLDLLDFQTEDYSFIPAKKLVLSRHFFEIPKNLESLVEELFSFPAEIYKLALLFQESWEVFSFLKSGIFERFFFNQKNRVLSLMGENLFWTRVTPCLFSSCWSYFCSSKETAPGQITLEHLNREYKALDQKNFSYFGLIGDPVYHSLSPRVHNAFFQKHNINSRYLLFPGKEPEQFLDQMSQRVEGLSVTTPFKKRIIPFLKHLDHFAIASGSVNTIQRKDGILIGYDTDGPGFRMAVDSFFQNWPSRVNKIIVCGSGALAESILAAFCDFQKILYVRARSLEKAQRLVRKFGVRILEWDKDPGLSKALVIQATSAGFENQDRILEEKWLCSDTLAAETVYFPSKTPFVRQCESANIVCMPGRELFIHQAMLQQKHWFGVHLTREEVLCAIKDPLP